ncbi:TonB-dependent receptor domain-containing protein [Alterisphingorhabdus coralli]|uniref:TonB-dependent receptor n=1 Tax=Alterisphingorhabdus coralli TaxID=3071408 RepID=A0AA97F9X5_9SPHN|nr:TonB-dependent receptor [Parasphingorhabdus sp. SCSIO 66989]WOE75747.1 TonB-dependent receptor [Parasphingorhabdus sp. SCSIO 66989]
MKKMTSFMAGAAPVAFALAMVASPASAQEQEVLPDQDAEEIEDDDDVGIVVTGTRIRRPDLASTTPTISVAGDNLFRQGEANVGDFLNDLPALRQTVSQSNPGLGIGISGLNLLDLRGLGVRRTLVVVNGRRHVPADIQSTASAVDINSIPAALIEGIDIVTGGSSAVYGSDAIAGVVNFRLRDEFDGIDIRARAGIPEFGDGADFLVSGVAGMDFADGRGHIVVAGEYSRQNRIFASDIPQAANAGQFVRTNVDENGRFDGIPDSVFTNVPTRSGTIHRFGLVGFPQADPQARCGGTILGGTTPYNCNYIFQPDGSLVFQTFDGRSSTSQFGGFIGGNGQIGTEDELTSILPFLERYSANLLAKYEFSDALEVFLEAKYIRADSLGSNSGPAFLQSIFTGGFSDGRVRPRLDNPFLQPQARAVIEQQLLAGGQSRNDLISFFGPLTAADEAAIADGSYRFALNKSFLDLGIRDQDTSRETYRIVLGARGDISSNWGYEVAFNYGRTDENIENLGNILTQRLILALDAGVDPADGQIKCRSQFDPASAVPLGAFGDNDQLAGDIAACVPYNPFGAPDNSAAAAYITADGGTQGTLEQYNALAFVSGNTADFLELPGGPIGVVLGLEYRREEAFFEADQIIADNLTFTNPLPVFDPDPFEVREVFGEINIPILADRPFFEELSILAAGRLSDYNGPVGTVFAWNVGGRWAPTKDLAFRAQFARAVRAPNYTETSGDLTQTFINGFSDPCGSNQIDEGSANRRANCEADLGAILNDPAFQQVANAAISVEGRNGPNANLFEETSDSLTLGLIYQPSWLPGFAVSVDYYDIEVDNVIASVAGQQIVNVCYDLPDLNNPFCGNFERNGATQGPQNEAPGQLLQGTLLQSPVNFASRRREGIDVDVSYRSAIGEDAFINARLIYTHVLTSSNFQDPTNPDFENRLLGELGDPQDQFVFNLDFTLGQVTFSYDARYIGPQLTTLYEEQFPLNGEPPQNPDRFDILEYPEILYHDFRIGWQIENAAGDNTYEFFVGVDNAFNERPPLGLLGTGDGSAIYDPIGRRFFTGLRALF